MPLNLPAAPLGKEMLNVDFGGTTLETFTYRPSGEIKGVLLNFHGTSRNADDYRDAAVKVADQYGLYVVAPKFDSREFSNSEYHRGGMLDGSRLLPKEDWTVSLVDDIAEWAHAKLGNDPNDETIAFGHSAGGQFLSRVAAFGPDIFDKIIIANPSTHVRASLSEDMPYGFDGLPAADAEAYLKDYLADPVTIYAGSRDNDPNDSQLSSGAAAMRQGSHRLDRAQNVYNEARELAASKGWEFNWELVVADGVAHSSSRMLNAPEFRQAFDGRTGDDRGPVQAAPRPEWAPERVPEQTPEWVPETAPESASPGNVHDFDRVSEWHGAVIGDFAKGDVIDFRDIDAHSRQRGHQDFDLLGLVGPSAFTSDGAQIRLRHHDGDTYVYLNTDRDSYYEAKGRIEGIHHLTEDDFLL
ncbi:hypothetical protein KTN05_14265 [Paracoccus sp. Z118]|uniref:alpha/beta hydrolase n=1 Tax=Paracoccus sp. Z118 TaxID=2851017 RepID=UPI001C2BCC58|nr:hypothetical protein [Paracoccus sp. Z118]MBV0893000.1 hypothetical protein [Paracoccus sp. Z118]